MAPDPASSLSRLSDGEQRVLRLLGAGHTAKSIAAETQLSVHAVNERLREARRKTGAGSSRELARMLLAHENRGSQKNRDEEIGVARPPPPDDAGAVPSHSAAGRRRNIIMAGSIVIVALGAVAAMTWHGARPSADPVLGRLLSDSGEKPVQLYAEVRRQPREAARAAVMEATLRDRYAAASGFPADRLRVLCAATLCEVAGPTAGIDADALVRMQQIGLSGLGDLNLQVAAFAIGGGSFVAYPRQRAGDAPVVVATTPARDTVLSAGPFTLSVTFDRAMMAGSMSFTAPDGVAAYPACDIDTLRQSADGTTYTMRCTAERGRRYAIGFNGPPYVNFRSREGVSAVPAVLRFRTAKGK